MNVKDTSYLLQASVLGVVMLWLHKQDQSLKKLTELCIDQIIGINHGEEGEKEDAKMVGCMSPGDSAALCNNRCDGACRQAESK